MTLGKTIRRACFLCDPDPELIYTENDHFVAMCGYGPVVPGYSIIATRAHVRSCADLNISELAELTRFVALVCERIGPSRAAVITEHGRVPICDYLHGEADPHCFHAHLLLFPDAPAIAESAARHAPLRAYRPTLADALSFASTMDHYILISAPGGTSFSIFAPPEPLIRQFARSLVADAISKPELTDWRAQENREVAVRYATEFRAATGGTP